MSVLSSLPQVLGRYTENVALGKKSWFTCGGAADVVFKPTDHEDLQHFLKNCPADIPVHVFGVMSNVIIRDGGVRGVVIRLGREFSKIEVEGDIVSAGALALDANVAQVAAENGLAGLEFLSGIPGSIGGALRMNAGCYGTEMKDVLIECEAIDRQGQIHVLTPDEMGMTYRHVEVPADYIFLKAKLKGVPDEAEEVKARIAQIKEQREESQPIREKTGGSTFANPSALELSQAGLSPDTKVWQLIDQVGGRGLKIGGAMMSEKHCNFMINTGEASASDLEELGEEIRARVLKKFGIALRWEIKRIGEKG
ncbi:MAG: UDP-N-acetylmuramate dehydrogenase [Alphaproteobacteria bacterium]|nr:UDP-N-acetylmuramate dehydrogenase [Alphaproteobacteria bacterium]